LDFENRELRKLSGHTRNVVTEGWRKLHNEELHNLYSSSNTIKVIKSGRMRWAWHVTSMGNMRDAYKILVGKPE
jgi:hypothetical protein